MSHGIYFLFVEVIVTLLDDKSPCFFVLQHHLHLDNNKKKKELKIHRHIAELFALNPVLLSIFCLNRSLW